MTDIQYQADAGVVHLTLSRPDAYNALSRGLMGELIGRLDDIAGDGGIRSVVISGAGRGFCAGHDLNEVRALNDRDERRALFELCSQMMLRIQSLPQPVIAAVHGIATAAGCQLVATADLAIAEPDARFATPGVNLGLFCSTPMVALSRSVGPKHAMQMLLGGEMIDAPGAVRIGLINEIQEGAVDAALDLARRIAEKSGPVLAIGKQTFYRQLQMDTADAYDHCSEVMARNLELRDSTEGIDAFLEKRSPAWEHK